MEDMARLAFFEQNVGDEEVFSKTLLQLLKCINNILDKPYDYELRTFSSDSFTYALNTKGFAEYLLYLGFQVEENKIVYPKEIGLNKLKLGQVAIERKLHFNGHQIIEKPKAMKCIMSLPQGAKVKLLPVNIETDNELFRTLTLLFNNVLKYEDEELLSAARSAIPVVTLQLRAQERMRSHQKRIKSGEITSKDMTFEMALLLELVGWFKHSFFHWIDKPECERCRGPTVFKQSVNMDVGSETCRVEVFECGHCSTTTRFPRYNNPGTLLRTRGGRCGEWANCFALLCRALGYDTRYVYDVGDHVWSEIYDYESCRWVHVDPCEARVGTPLMYEHGWRKQLTYVLAVSRDDLQDVTWRYSSEHGAVRGRRGAGEGGLVAHILRLRAARQAQVSPRRRQYLARRTLMELVELMVERTPSDHENLGRISGAAEWRLGRGEVGRHSFTVGQPGHHRLSYCAARDTYRLTRDEEVLSEVQGWERGAYEATNVFRKVETDWRMVYLAREEGSPTGCVSWKVTAAEGLVLSIVTLSAETKVYETGRVEWTIQLDNGPVMPFLMADWSKHEGRQFKELVLKVELSGGVGDVAWQHAQLFRQSTDDDDCTFQIQLQAERTETFGDNQ